MTIGNEKGVSSQLTATHLVYELVKQREMLKGLRECRVLSTSVCPILRRR